MTARWLRSGRIWLSLLATVAAGAGGCVSRTTGETEVGVLVCKLGIGCAKKGVQDQLYPPGSTNLFAPFIRDFYTFDTKVQNLEMTANVRGGDRTGRDDLQFKTTDGNDISMDVTVVWTVDPKQVPRIVQEVGTSTEQLKEKVVRPMARTLVRDVLNELDSEAVYNSDKRFEKADKARQVLTTALAAFGVNIMQVILHEHRFAPEYEKVIHDRKLAEQHAEQLKSETEAVGQEALRNLETARGRVASQIAQAEGKLKQVSLSSDAAFYAQQQNAEALLAERTAKAKAIAKRNEALRGAGGKAMVKLKIADALDGKSIVLVPGGAAGAGFNKMDVNKLIDAFKEEPAAKEGAP
ncbi:MAG TPA: SPFH domain-containing protein [Polyangia bacterium]|jgi:regulator of protease activity HflC (stomatin/prohibitin superfamily)|nr:SPFH domain-containing protein [Polyangia bacterium]